MSTGCSYCGANPYVGCKHQSAVPRPQAVAEPTPDEPKKTDLRPFSLPGRAFATSRYKEQVRKAKQLRALEALQRGHKEWRDAKKRP